MCQLPVIVTEGDGGTAKTTVALVVDITLWHGVVRYWPVGHAREQPTVHTRLDVAVGTTNKSSPAGHRLDEAVDVVVVNAGSAVVVNTIVGIVVVVEVEGKVTEIGPGVVVEMVTADGGVTAIGVTAPVTLLDVQGVTRVGLDGVTLERLGCVPRLEVLITLLIPLTKLGSLEAILLAVGNPVHVVDGMICEPVPTLDVVVVVMSGAVGTLVIVAAIPEEAAIDVDGAGVAGRSGEHTA